MAKYTNALYPDKINDLIDNDGNINPEVIPSEKPYEWTTGLKEEISETKYYLILTVEDFAAIAEKQPIKINMTIVDGEAMVVPLVYTKLITNGVQYNGHIQGQVVYIDMFNDDGNVFAIMSIGGEDDPESENDYEGFAHAVGECWNHLGDNEYSNKWTFTFKNAVGTDLVNALNSILEGQHGFEVFSSNRLTLSVNVNGSTELSTSSESEIKLGITPQYFLRVWLEMGMQSIHCDYATFSGTVELTFSDNQE